MKRNQQSGEAVTIILVALLLVGASAFGLSKTKWFHGDSKRAAASQASTAQVQNTVTRVDDAEKKRSATAAASVVKIAEANAQAPESKPKDFIAKEVTVALANLEAPDPQALLAAEQRKNAVLQGQYALVARLYGEAAKDAAAKTDALAAERVARAKALAERDAIDRELADVAAGRLAAEKQRAILFVVAGLLAALWVYTKLFSIGPASLGNIAADIRAGVSPIQALDTHLAPWLHPMVAKQAQLATPLPEQIPPPPSSSS